MHSSFPWALFRQHRSQGLVSPAPYCPPFFFCSASHSLCFRARSLTKRARSSSVGFSTQDPSAFFFLIQAEREAWIKKKKAEGSWVENPTEEDRARFVKERARKQREWEAEQKRKGGQ